MNLLTTVNNNGIVSNFQIHDKSFDPENPTMIQLIWCDMIRCTCMGVNNEPVTYSSVSNTWYIKNYRAIYLNGIMIVKHGEVWPRRYWWWPF